LSGLRQLHGSLAITHLPTAGTALARSTQLTAALGVIRPPCALSDQHQHRAAGDLLVFTSGKGEGEIMLEVGLLIPPCSW